MRKCNENTQHHRFAGTIAPEIGRLVDLEHFNLTSNSIGGSLPPDIGDMPKLKVFHMSKNLLGQSIPKTIGELTKLRDLDLSFNMLKGTVPYELGKCTQLSSLRLGECCYTSVIVLRSIFVTQQKLTTTRYDDFLPNLRMESTFWQLAA